VATDAGEIDMIGEARSLWLADTQEPVLETTLGSVLREAAAHAPDQTAVVAWSQQPGERRTWTYAELLRDAERAAHALLERFVPGEHIAVYAPNVPEWLLLELGAGLAGLVLVTVNPASRSRELGYVLRQSRSAGVFFADSFRGNPMRDWVAEVREELPGLREAISFEDWPGFLGAPVTGSALPDVRPDDPAQIQYTSGTTGSPKGALLHHRGLTNNSRFYAQLIALREDGVYAHAMPFFHTAGCVMAALGTIQARATHAFLPSFEPARLLELMEQEGATHMLGVPTMMIAIMEHPDFEQRDLSSLRVAVAGGASVPPGIVRRIESRLGARFCIVYGQTEASPLIAQTRLDDSPEDKANTVGTPVPRADVKIGDPDTGEPVEFDTVGELCVRGYMVMKEYFDKPEATSAALDKDRWLHTGDLATMDERGYCRITGRLKDMVIRGGENLFPAEIEAVLIEHPDVTEAAVIGVPDPLMGEELAAFIRISGRSPNAVALREYVGERLAGPKAPRYWVFVDEFPLTGSGKIQKFLLRERWLAGVNYIDATAGRRA
jgi:fatty-acyl-CoA synthase